jgi:hypothetical protein
MYSLVPLLFFQLLLLDAARSAAPFPNLLEYETLGEAATRLWIKRALPKSRFSLEGAEQCRAFACHWQEMKVGGNELHCASQQWRGEHGAAAPEMIFKYFAGHAEWRLERNEMRVDDASAVVACLLAQFQREPRVVTTDA